MPPRCSISYVRYVEPKPNTVKEALMSRIKDIKAFVKDKMVFCGIDVHKNHWVVCLICDGEILHKVRMDVNFTRLKFLLQNYRDARKIKFVYEAGFSGFWLYRELTNAGYDCIVTPPNKMQNSGDKVKTDKRDAEKLASYLSAGLLKAVCVPPKDIEGDRRVMRRRKQLSKMQTRAKNQIRAFLNLFGITVPASIKRAWCRQYLSWLDDLQFENPSDRFTFSDLVKTYRRIRQDLAEVTRFIRTLAHGDKYNKNFKLLTSVRGVGLITAMTFLLEIFDFGRFSSQEKFSSYLGLTPAQYSTGDKVRLGHITRQGNAYLRHLLVESAWTVIRYDPFLRDKYDRIKARGTNGKKAIVAVARSMAVRLRRCLLDNTEYVVGCC